MDEILGDVYDLPGTYTFLAIADISLIIHIISLKKWFDNGIKNEKNFRNDTDFTD